MAQHLIQFDTWEQLLEAARKGEPLWYQAPMDVAQAYPAKQVAVVRVYKNGKLRIDPLSNQADPFTCDSGHLYRFRRQLRHRCVVRVEGAPAPVHTSPWGTLKAAEHAAENHRAMIRDRGWNHAVTIEQET